MAENLKIIPLGGLNEIGKNMTVYEYGGEIIVVDCGMAFPGDDMYGIDLVIPDVSYLTKHKNRIRGLFITHGHEDHIGAIPYVLKQVNMPIYCTRLTAGLIRLKLEEHGLLKSTKIVTVESGMTVKAGKFSVEFIHVNHSIADSVAFAIHTGLGTVVHTGDFKRCSWTRRSRYQAGRPVRAGRCTSRQGRRHCSAIEEGSPRRRGCCRSFCGRCCCCSALSRRSISGK